MKKIIRNLRTLLIHILGGITLEENKESGDRSFNSGKHVAYCRHLEYARNLYGLPAEEWCKAMYEVIEDDFNDMMQF